MGKNLGNAIISISENTWYRPACGSFSNPLPASKLKKRARFEYKARKCSSQYIQAKRMNVPHRGDFGRVGGISCFVCRWPPWEIIRWRWRHHPCALVGNNVQTNRQKMRILRWELYATITLAAKSPRYGPTFVCNVISIPPEIPQKNYTSYDFFAADFSVNVILTRFWPWTNLFPVGKQSRFVGGREIGHIPNRW